MWITILHSILEIELSPLTTILVGAVIVVYQQFSVQQEDLIDGFFEHCQFNGTSPINYALAKALSVWLSTLFPMALLLVLFGFGLTATILITMQWMLLNTCIACLMIFIPISNHKANPLNLLLAWLPLLIAPIIFLIDYLQYYNKNSLLIFLGCDTIIMCTVFLPFYFNRLKV
ncbi:MAG: hypothetical protein NT128_06480 [Proteobacteria bacterium]|nr:hypothetical protein [Pseudomonadota bacterium]